MYRVFLRLTIQDHESVAKITIANSAPFSDIFSKFVYQSCQIVSEEFFIDDDYCEGIMDIFIFLRDIHVDSLAYFLGLLEHCSCIFYRHNYNKSAISDFCSDILKRTEYLPF